MTTRKSTADCWRRISMYYEWEWLSDIAIIPAFELVLIGFLAGAAFVGAMWLFEWRRKK